MLSSSIISSQASSSMYMYSPTILLIWLQQMRSIIAIFMAKKYRKQLLEFLEKGGLHTPRIKVSSALLRGGMYSGIGFTIVWGIYLFFVIFWFVAMIFALATGLNY